MEILIRTFLGMIAVVTNLVFLQYWKSVEERESAAGLIPPHKLVSGNLSVRIGDRYALSVMDFAIAFILHTRGLPSAQTLMICVVGGIAWVAASQTFWFFKKKPGSSSLGKMRIPRAWFVHLPYYGAQYIVGFIGLAVIYDMTRGEVPWSPMVIMGLVAAGFYFFTIWLDMAKKRA